MLYLPHYGAFDILVCQIHTIAPYKPKGVGLCIDRCISHSEKAEVDYALFSELSNIL